MTPNTSANYSLPDVITATALSNFAYQYGEPGVNFTQLLNSNGWNVIATKAAPGLPGYPAGIPDNAFAYAVSRDLSPDKVQFAFALRGSDNPVDDWRDWIWNNASKYGFSHCCQQVREPLAQMVKETRIKSAFPEVL